jgi:hypothetical protein
MSWFVSMIGNKEICWVLYVVSGSAVLAEGGGGCKKLWLGGE